MTYQTRKEILDSSTITRFHKTLNFYQNELWEPWDKIEDNCLSSAN